MKDLSNIEKTVYLEEYDITVNRFLSVAEIQQITNATIALSKPDEAGDIHNSWSERQQNIDMLLLYHCTDIDKKKLKKLSHEELTRCGLIDAVRDAVENSYRIEEAIAYEEGFTKAFAMVADRLPAIIEQAKSLKYFTK